MGGLFEDSCGPGACVCIQPWSRQTESFVFQADFLAILRSRHKFHVTLVCRLCVHANNIFQEVSPTSPGSLGRSSIKRIRRKMCGCNWEAPSLSADFVHVCISTNQLDRNRNVVLYETITAITGIWNRTLSSGCSQRQVVTSRGIALQPSARPFVQRTLHTYHDTFVLQTNNTIDYFVRLLQSAALQAAVRPGAPRGMDNPRRRVLCALSHPPYPVPDNIQCTVRRNPTNITYILIVYRFDLTKTAS